MQGENMNIYNILERDLFQDLVIDSRIILK
jgi:hypothetical protein